MPPQVQSLSDILAGLNPQYQPQIQAVQDQIGTTQQNAQAQQSGLDAAKTQGFQDITNQANQRGMLFSGFTPYEQAQYLSTKYLPAVATLNNNTDAAISKLNSNAQTLRGQEQTDANSTLQSQQKAYSDWQAQQQQLAQQLAIAQMNNQTKLQAANISASRAPAVTAGQQKQQDVGSLYSQLQKVAGGDGYISPSSYAQGLQAWQQAGYTAQDYDNLFSSLRNPKNTHYKLAAGYGS